RRRHTRSKRDWSSDVCSSDLSDIEKEVFYMQKEKVIIVGGGPCGLACSLALQKHGMDSLVIEKGNIVQTIYNFPTHQRSFSSSERLEIGGIPFITEKQKPVRNEALAYYRSVVARNHLRIHTFEKVIHVMKD